MTSHKKKGLIYKFIAFSITTFAALESYRRVINDPLLLELFDMGFSFIIAIVAGIVDIFCEYFFIERPWKKDDKYHGGWYIYAMVQDPDLRCGDSKKPDSKLPRVGFWCINHFPPTQDIEHSQCYAFDESSNDMFKNWGRFVCQKIKISEGENKLTIDYQVTLSGNDIPEYAGRMRLNRRIGNPYLNGCVYEGSIKNTDGIWAYIYIVRDCQFLVFFERL